MNRNNSGSSQSRQQTGRQYNHSAGENGRYSGPGGRGRQDAGRQSGYSQARRKKKINTRNLAILIIILAVGSIGVFGIQFWMNRGSSTEADTQTAEQSSESETVPEQAAAPTDEEKKTAKAASLISSMSQDEKIGQLFLARVPESGAIDDITTYKLGGYLIFGRDVEGETTDSFKAKVQSWQDAASTPMLIASDEEGGTVTRVSYGDGMVGTAFASPQDLYAQGGLDAIAADTKIKSGILKNLGINVNLAPVADVAEDPNSFMYDRTLGQDAQGEAEYVKTVVENMQGTGVGSCLKHFPGYGENGDSHTDIIHDTRDLDHFETIDFIPFKAGIDAGAGSVLISHNIAEAIDADEPASLSPAVHQVLRDELGFNGVIITDDFDMAGLADYTDQNTAAVDTINAGSDLIISSSYAAQISAVSDAVNNGTISEDTLEAAVAKVLKWKMDLGLISY
ncbi:MAG: glycoside hydrolase family 3 protein [Eubacteriaceae bacterium]